MLKILIKATGETQEVTRNVAFDLIDRGLATLLPIAGTKTVDRAEDAPLYLNRQMRASIRRRKRQK